MQHYIDPAFWIVSLISLAISVTLSLFLYLAKHIKDAQFVIKLGFIMVIIKTFLGLLCGIVFYK